MEKQRNYSLVIPTAENSELVQGAVELVNHFYEQNLMLPVQEDHYQQLSEKKRLVVAIDNDQRVIGTAAMSQEYPGGVLEFGGWAVEEEWQRFGVGVALLFALFQENGQHPIISFANSNSAPIFEKLGAEEITDFSDVLEEAFALCANCPNKPEGGGCCDTIYNLAPVVVNLLGDQHWFSQPKEGGGCDGK